MIKICDYLVFCVLYRNKNVGIEKNIATEEFNMSVVSRLQSVVPEGVCGARCVLSMQHHIYMGIDIRTYFWRLGVVIITSLSLKSVLIALYVVIRW